jgi:DNA-binding MarR family transcriptional regulator
MANDYGELALDEFVEAVFKLIIDHHHRRVIELDLTLPQAQTLRILGRKALSTSGLAAELRISAPAVTQLTDRLTRKALIDRKPVEGDRRKVLLALTLRGKGLVDGFRRHRNQVFASALGHLNPEDRAEVVEALRKISWALGTEASRPEPAETPRAADASRPPSHQAEASKDTTGARPASVPRRIRMEWD